MPKTTLTPTQEFPFDVRRNIAEQSQPGEVSDAVSKRIEQLNEAEAEKRRQAEQQQQAALDRYVATLNGGKSETQALDGIIATLGLDAHQAEADRALLRQFHQCVDDSRFDAELKTEARRLRARIAEFEAYAKEQIRGMRKLKAAIETKQRQAGERLRDLRRAAGQSPLFLDSFFACHGSEIPQPRAITPDIPDAVVGEYSTRLMFSHEGPSRAPVYSPEFELDGLSFVRAVGTFSGGGCVAGAKNRKRLRAMRPCPLAQELAVLYLH